MVPRTNYGSHNWSATGGLTVAGADQLWQPQSVRGGPFVAREIAIAGPPRTDCGWDQLARDSTLRSLSNESACAVIIKLALDII